MSKIDKLYKNYFKINSMVDLTNKKKEISPKDLITRIRHEKDLLAKIICEVVEFNNSVEFSNAYYIDNGLIVPTISHSLSKLGKTTTLVSPYLKSSNKNSFNIIRSPLNYPFASYEPSSKNNVSKIMNTGVFITEDDINLYIKHFGIYAGFNTPCIYAVTGKINETIKKMEETKKLFSDATQNNLLDYEMNVKMEDDVAGAIFVIKRK